MPHRNPLQPVALIKTSSQLPSSSQACAQQTQSESNTTTFLHMPHRLANDHTTNQNLSYYNGSRRQRRPVSDTTVRHSAQQSRSASRSHSNTILHQHSASSERRSRQPIACDPCRASKRKCSGGQPCISCLKRGGKVECYYDKAAELKLVARQKTLAMTTRAQREATTSRKRGDANIAQATKTMDRRSVSTRTNQNPTRKATADVDFQAHSGHDNRCDEHVMHDVDESEADDAYMETVPTRPTYLNVGHSWTPPGSHSVDRQRRQERHGVELLEPPVTPKSDRHRPFDPTPLSTASSQQSSIERHGMSSPTTPSQQAGSPSQSSAFSGISSQRSEVGGYQDSDCHRLFGEAVPSKPSEGCANSLLPRHLPRLQASWAMGRGHAASAFLLGGAPQLPRPLRPLGSSNTIGFSCIGRPAFSKPIRLSTVEPALENRAMTIEGLVGDGAFLPSAREGNVPAWIKPYPYPRPGVDPRAGYSFAQTAIGHQVRGGVVGLDVSSGQTLAPMIRPPYAPTSQHRSTTSATSSPAGLQTRRFAPRHTDPRLALPPLVPRDLAPSLFGLSSSS